MTSEISPPTENRILVIQPGTLCTKYGLSDHKDLPKVVPSVAPRSGLCKGEPLYYLQNGHVTDWDSLKKHWIEIFKSDVVNVDPENNDFYLTLCIPLCWSLEERRMATKIAFEVLNVLGLFIIEQPLAAAYGCNLTSALIVDIGYENTVITPVLDGMTMNIATKSIPLAGKLIEETLENILKDDPEFLETAEQDFLNDPKGYTRLVLSSELVNCIANNAKKEAIINGKNIKTSTKVSKCIDILFDPIAFGKQIIDIPHACRLVVNDTYDNERFLTLWKNIFITGGCSLLRGIKKRFELEMVRVISTSETSNDMQAREIGWVIYPDYLSSYNDKPQHASFLGGAIASKMSYLLDITKNITKNITKEDYEKKGPNAAFVDV